MGKDTCPRVEELSSANMETLTAINLDHKADRAQIVSKETTESDLEKVGISLVDRRLLPLVRVITHFSLFSRYSFCQDCICLRT